MNTSGRPDAREVILDAGVELVIESGGLTSSCEHIPFERIVERSGLARSTAYRVWRSRDEFYAELLLRLSTPLTLETLGTSSEVEQVLVENLELLRTPEGRWSLLRMVARVGAAQNFDAVLASVEWRTYITLSATLPTVRAAGEDGNLDRSRVRLQRTLQQVMKGLSDFYGTLAGIMGYRIRPPLRGWDHFALLGSAVVEGLCISCVVDPSLAEERLVVDGPDGPEEWSLPAWAYWGVVVQNVELDPDDDLSFEDRVAALVQASAGR